jgi:hypothetical protein
MIIQTGFRMTLPVVLLSVFAAAVTAQRARRVSNRIDLAKTPRVSLTGRLSNGREMEYVFLGKRAQKVELRMRTPGFDYRIYLPGTDFDTEFDSSPSSIVELPEEGEYLLFIRKKMTRRAGLVRFNILVTIR